MTTHETDFVHLSVHSDMSATAKATIGDYPGSARVVEYVKRAAELGYSALACTELGSLRGIYQLAKESAKAGVRPIFGVEVYVTADHTKRAISKEDQAKITAGLPPEDWRDAIDAYAREHGYMQRENDLTTLTLWALDDDGLRNLIALTSKAWIDGYYYKPRVDLALIEEHSAGVACGTGGPRSYVNRPIIDGKRAEALDRARELARIFGDRLYAEVQPHALMINGKANAFALQLDSMGLAKLLATGAVHYLSQGDLKYQKMISAIGFGSGSELSRDGLEIDSYWLRTRAEMVEGLCSVGLDVEQAERACLETLELAKRCSAELAIDPFAMIMPEIDTGELSHVEYLAKLCDASPKWSRLPSDRAPEYRERLAHELEQLGRPVAPNNPATFAGYVVYVREVCELARSLGIALGPGRGSAAGSLVNYLVGITDVDPIEHGLLFSRFIDPSRIGPPDVDVDCDADKRGMLIEAMRERWGDRCVAQISNFSKMKGRMIVADVCRELSIPLLEVRAVTKHVDQRSDNDERPFETVRDAFVGSEHAIAHPDCVAFAEKYPEFLPYALALEGKLRSLGVHAAGIVVSPRALLEFTPLETRPGDKDGERVIVTAFDMIGVDQVGLLKIDMLALKTVTTIDAAFRAIEARHGVHVDWSSIPLDDTDTLAAFEAGDLAGVFQFDSASARRLCRGVRFDSFGVIADMTALNRPGPLDSGMADQYLERMADPSLVTVDYCDLVSEITRDTFGVMVYQEQVMRVCGEVGLHENPDTMRKIIGKKLMDKIEAERPGFLAGASKSAPEMSSETANKLFSDIVTFGRYGFNKSHSVAYAKLGYIQQWIKVHYPLEFYWSLIMTAKDDKRRSIAKDAAARGIELASPNVNVSGHELAIDYERGVIVGALSDIKGVGGKAAEAITAAQPFASFADFMERTSGRAVTSGTVKALASAGALDDLIPNVKWFLDNADDLFHRSKLKSWGGWEAELAKATGDDFTDDERKLAASLVNPMALESPYAETLDALPLVICDPFDDGFMEANDGQACWFAGRIVEPRVYQETPWDGREPTEAEAKHESYGADYASASLEFDSGQVKKLKIPWWVYREIPFEIDGADVLVLATPGHRYDNLGARLVVSLESLRTGEGEGLAQRFAKGEGLALLESEGCQRYELAIAAKPFGKLAHKLHTDTDCGWDRLPVTGLVTDIKTKLSGKREQEMADVGILTPTGERAEVRVFASDWLGGWDARSRQTRDAISKAFGVGSLVSMNAESNEWQGRHSLVYKGGLKVHKR